MTPLDAAKKMMNYKCSTPEEWIEHLESSGFRVVPTEAGEDEGPPRDETEEADKPEPKSEDEGPSFGGPPPSMADLRMKAAKNALFKGGKK